MGNQNRKNDGIHKNRTSKKSRKLEIRKIHRSGKNGTSEKLASTRKVEKLVISGRKQNKTCENSWVPGLQKKSPTSESNSKSEQIADTQMSKSIMISRETNTFEKVASTQAN